MGKTKRIKFSKPIDSDSGKTQVWDVLDSDGDTLGQVRWFGRWRRYSFYPSPFTVYEKDCLREVANFCERESYLLRQKWWRIKH